MKGMATGIFWRTHPAGRIVVAAGASFYLRTCPAHFRAGKQTDNQVCS